MAALTIADAVLLQQRATPEEREVFGPDPHEVFDPLESGPEMIQWTTWVHEMDTLARLIVLIERHPKGATRVGGFRVLGAGQWLRDRSGMRLEWSHVTRACPRKDSDLFCDAFVLQGLTASGSTTADVSVSAAGLETAPEKVWFPQVESFVGLQA